MKLQHYLSWALWGAHRFNRGQQRAWRQFEQSKPKTVKAERKEELSSSLLPLYSGRMSTCFAGLTEDLVHWAAAADGPKRRRIRESATEGLPCLFSGFMNLADRKERSTLIELKMSLFIAGQLDYLTFKGPCQSKLFYDSVNTSVQTWGRKTVHKYVAGTSVGHSNLFCLCSEQ